MLLSGKKLGAQGERLACDYLEKKGYKILFAPWERLPYGEIDIVAKKGNELVFVEVKTRVTDDFGLPEDSVTEAKLTKLEMLIDFFLNQHGYAGLPYRLDIIAILMKEDGFDLRHLEGVGY